MATTLTFSSGKLEHHGDALAAVMRLLPAGPDRGFAVAHVGDAAGGCHAGMRVERPLVGGLDDPGRIGKRLVDIADILLVVAMHRLGVADVIEQVFLVGEGRLHVRPRDLELLGGPDRVPLLGRDEADETLLPDHLHARNVFHRGFVDRDRHRAGDRRTDHASVQHAGNFHVHHVVERAEHLRRDVAPRACRACR